MISREEMPDDNAELRNVDVEFSRLQPDSSDACPVSFEDIVSYLRLESPDHDSVEEAQLHFVRTALVDDHRYWIWTFRESDGADCFVTVSQSPDGTTCTGYEENYYDLTAEQFILGTHYDVF